MRDEDQAANLLYRTYYSTEVQGARFGDGFGTAMHVKLIVIGVPSFTRCGCSPRIRRATDACQYGQRLRGVVSCSDGERLEHEDLDRASHPLPRFCRLEQPCQ